MNLKDQIGESSCETQEHADGSFSTLVLDSTLKITSIRCHANLSEALDGHDEAICALLSDLKKP